MAMFFVAKGKCHITISKITKKNFSIFLKSGAQIVDGDIISDSGKNKEHVLWKNPKFKGLMK